MRRISDMTCIAAKNFDIGYFKCFLKMGADYVFGCDKGVALTSNRFELLSIVPSKDYIHGLVKYSDDMIVTAEYFGHI